MVNFDAKRVTPLEWAGIGAGALAFIDSFLPWYTVSYEGVLGFNVGGSASGNAWNYALSLLAVLMLVGAGVVVLLPHLDVQVPNQVMIWLGLSGVALVFIVIRWLTFDSGSGLGISAGPGFGLFVGLVLAVVSGVAAFLTYRSANTRTSAA